MIFHRIITGVTQTWRGRFARMLAFFAGWIYTNALVARMEGWGDPQRILIGIVVGSLVLLLSFMIGDQ